MSYLHLGALVLGPLLLLLALFLILSRGRKKTVSEAARVAAEAIAAAAEVRVVEPVDPSVVVPAGRPGTKPAAAVVPGVPIAEDPQKVYFREQIQQLGKSNPATVAQLIQTWMDEDRRN